ncbi:hypothetical protein SESBI_42235 [Sesbania bispinosa]|nr:hypothetical protein SESBI_42235 [Sesbania bispinosa]
MASRISQQEHQAHVEQNAKAPMVDLLEAQMERLSSGLGLVAEALNTGNAISEKLHDVAECQVSLLNAKLRLLKKRNDIIERTRPRFKMVGSSSKRLRNGKSKKVAAKNTKKPSSGSKKTTVEGSKQQSSRKGKLNNSVHDPTLLRSLDYSRFFSHDNQVESFLEGFLARPVVEPRSGLQIPKKLNADDNLEGEVNVGWSNRFDKRTLNKMKIIQFNGVWQYAHEGVVAPNDEVEEAAAAPAEPSSLPQGYQVGEQPTQSIPMEDMIKYIYSTLHNIEHSLENLSNYVGDLNSKMDKKFDELGMRMKVVEDQLAQGPPNNDHNV